MILYKVRGRNISDIYLWEYCLSWLMFNLLFVHFAWKLISFGSSFIWICIIYNTTFMFRHVFRSCRAVGVPDYFFDSDMRKVLNRANMVHRHFILCIKFEWNHQHLGIYIKLKSLWVEISHLRSYIGVQFFELTYYTAKICVDIWSPELWFTDILQIFSCLV